MTIITKGMGAIMKAAMKKAGVTKPTFPGPRATELLNKRLKENSGDRSVQRGKSPKSPKPPIFQDFIIEKRLKKNKARGSDRVEGALKIRKSKTTGKQIPSASAIEIDARINRKFYKDFNPGQK